MNPTSLGNMMICVGVCVLATVLPRILPLYAFSRELPAFVKTWLNYIPAAVMAALVAPDLLFYGGTFNPDPLNNVFLLAGIAGFPTALTLRSVASMGSCCWTAYADSLRCAKLCSPAHHRL